MNADNVTITNNGAINISGDDIREAILVPNTGDFQLINNGTISHSAGGVSQIIAILSLGVGANLNNSGTIIGTYNNSLSIVNLYSGILFDGAELNNSGNIEIVSDLGAV
ncbi:hypothetical protein B9G39_29685 [Zooshikella ganghwensis]|uniref:Uncharacterized protein n=2 Tax=Zooshikella ganghwensis TaxID=202772 RepID=A0A4P9VGG7_9GAMM|nr:hypothetical protein B9G39_29685 [Zooshikella ganghwensis]